MIASDILGESTPFSGPGPPAQPRGPASGEAGLHPAGPGTGKMGRLHPAVLPGADLGVSALEEDLKLDINVTG